MFEYSSLLNRSQSDDHNLSAELGDTDNSGSVDGGEDTSADGVGSASGGGCSESLESTSSLKNLPWMLRSSMLACIFVILQMKS